jgi:hypothetical protein
MHIENFEGGVYITVGRDCYYINKDHPKLSLVKELFHSVTESTFVEMMQVLDIPAKKPAPSFSWNVIQTIDDDLYVVSFIDRNTAIAFAKETVEKIRRAYKADMSKIFTLEKISIADRGIMFILIDEKTACQHCTIRVMPITSRWQ